MYDVIVVGLGPAGSTAAYTLARDGFKVLAFDKETFPRYKSCGGCISTKVDGLLGFDFSPVVEDVVKGATYTYKCSRTMDIISDRPLGYNVMRDSFDSFLADKAGEAGAHLRQGCRIKSVSESNSCVTVTDTDGNSYTARFLIGAEGAGGFIGRSYFNLDHKQSAVSITAEVPYGDGPLKAPDGRLFIDFGSVPFGYGWIFPKKKSLSVGLAVDASRARGTVRDYFNSFIEHHGILKQINVNEKVGWTVPLFYNPGMKVARGRVLLAGDSGHLVDPFLGEGIYFAIKTAKGAAQALSRCLREGHADLGGYQRWLEEEIYPDFKAAEKLSDLVYNHPRLWYSILEKDPDIMIRYYDVIRGTESNRSFYEWVYSRVSSKPWQMVRRWVESRFLPV